MVNRRDNSRSAECLWFFVPLVLIVLANGCGLPQNVEILPLTDVNRPCCQHDVTARVTDANGKPVPFCLVEWILPRSDAAVGVIVDARGVKKTNTYARTKTNRDGEATITIASTQEGRTPIIAVARDIKDKSRHKAFAVKHWLDVAVEFPSNATRKVGKKHELVTRVFKASDQKEPLPGYRVEFQVPPGEEASFESNGMPGTNWIAIETDENGAANVMLYQFNPRSGKNTIKITVRHPDHMEAICCPKMSKIHDVIAEREVIKTWVP